MVGIILTGHGRFADGLTSSVDLIAGPQKDYVAVNFEHEVDELTTDLNAAFDQLQDCDGVIVFTDLQGGSPFKTAVELSVSRENVEIIAGTNLPMLAEVIMARSMGLDLDTLASMAINTGKDQVTRFELASIMGDDQDEDNEDFSNGI